jgi:hypothetical protein
VTITWTAGTAAASSLIRYGTISGVYPNTIDPATSPQTISGLANGTAIYYQVGSRNTAGSTWSAQYSVTPVAPPQAPTAISATVWAGQATITWTAGSGSTSSLIRYGTATGVYTATIDPATSPQTISGLTNGTTIYYQVGAKNAAGVAWSAEYSFTVIALSTQTWTTPGTYTYLVPNGVTSLTITATGAGGGGGGGGDWDCYSGIAGFNGGVTSILYQSATRVTAGGGQGGNPGGDDSPGVAGGDGGAGTGTLSAQTITSGTKGGDSSGSGGDVSPGPGGAPNGGDGGWGSSDGSWTSGGGGGGGGGGQVSGVLSVTPGTVVTIVVGAGGSGGLGGAVDGPYGDDGMPGDDGYVTISYVQ